MTDTKKREKARQAPTYSHVGETGHFNFSPAGFRRWANQFYKCRQSFQCPDFSPVPYFLLCRAIELQFKAVHLEQLKAGAVVPKPRRPGPSFPENSLSILTSQ